MAHRQASPNGWIEGVCWTWVSMALGSLGTMEMKVIQGDLHDWIGAIVMWSGEDCFHHQQSIILPTRTRTTLHYCSLWNLIREEEWEASHSDSYQLGCNIGASSAWWRGSGSGRQICPCPSRGSQRSLWPGIKTPLATYSKGREGVLLDWRECSMPWVDMSLRCYLGWKRD